MITRLSSPTGITSRGPTVADADFSLSAVARDTVITPGTTEQSVVDDRNMTTHTSATVDHEYNLQAAEIVRGTFAPYLRFESLDPSIATVNQVGVVERVTNGTARMLAKTRLINRRVDVAVSRQGGQTTTTLDSYTAGSLARECSTAVDSRIAGKTPAVAKPVFSTQDHNAGVYVRNVNCWAYGVDLTCVSPWNSSGGIYYAGTAISPRHIIFVRHARISSNATVRFVTAGNVVVTRTMTNQVSLVGADYEYDLTIGLLDSALPNTISPAKVLPANMLNHLPSLSLAYPLPSLLFDYEEKALVSDLYTLSGTMAQYRVPSDATRIGFFEPLIDGDSGNPIFKIIGGALVLESIASLGGAGQGPRIHALHTEINAAMTSLGGGYQLTDVSLAGFTDFS